MMKKLVMVIGALSNFIPTSAIFVNLKKGIQNRTLSRKMIVTPFLVITIIIDIFIITNNLIYQFLLQISVTDQQPSCRYIYIARWCSSCHGTILRCDNRHRFSCRRQVRSTPTCDMQMNCRRPNRSTSTTYCF